MSDRNYDYNKIVVDEEEHIYVLMGGEQDSRIIKYSFSGESMNVAKEELVIYSLEENNNVNQAVMLFQQAYPEVKISIETGLDSGGAVSVEEALSVLNTRILAGDGPDLIVMDGISSDSYIEAGVLEELSDIVEELSEEEYLMNIVEAYGNEGEYYLIPTHFSLMLVEGDEEAVNQAGDISELTKRLKELEDEAEAGVYADYAFERIVDILYKSDLGNRSGENREITEEEIRAFFIQMEEIYKLYVEDEDDEHGHNDSERSLELSNFSIYPLSHDAIEEVVSGKAQIGIDYLNAPADLRMIIGLHRFSELSYGVIRGDAGGIFLPQVVLGVNSMGEHTELAKDFVTFMITEEVQNSYQYAGFPVNVNSLKYGLSEIKDFSGVIVGIDGDEYEMVDYEDLSDVEKERILSLFYDLVTPVEEDRIVTDLVMEQLETYLQGNQSLDHAVSTVAQKITLYYSE